MGEKMPLERWIEYLESLLPDVEYQKRP